jgi:hypothetical protein
MQPNVLEVGFDWILRPGEEPWLRVYIPNLPLVKLQEEEEENRDEEIGSATRLEVTDREEQLRGWCQELLPGKQASKARGIALIATKFIKDGEEVLQVRYVKLCYLAIMIQLSFTFMLCMTSLQNKLFKRVSTAMSDMQKCCYHPELQIES